MLNGKQSLTADEMIEAVRQRGYSTAPFRNNKDEICGYNLRGPRGHKRFITPDSDGLYPAVIVSLWCDGVDYAERKFLESRQRVG